MVYAFHMNEKTLSFIPHTHQNTGHDSRAQPTAHFLPKGILIKSEKAIIILGSLLQEMGFEPVLEGGVDMARWLRGRWEGLSDGGAWLSSTWLWLWSCRSKCQPCLKRMSGWVCNGTGSTSSQEAIQVSLLGHCREWSGTACSASFPTLMAWLQFWYPGPGTSCS